MNPAMAEEFEAIKGNAEAVESAIIRARNYLLRRQEPEGYWAGFLDNDSSCTGMYILAMYYLEQVEPARIRKAVHYLIRSRNEEGGWTQVPEGGSHLDVTLINYIALVLAGVPEDDQDMERTRNLIVRLGGLDEANFITRIFLAFFGVFPLESLPYGTTRLIDNAGFVYRQGFPRTILIPYLVLFELKAVRDFSDRMPLALGCWGASKKRVKEEVLQTFLTGFSIFHDPVTSVVHQEKCLGWIAERQEEDGVWAGVFQVTVFSLMALHADADDRWMDAIEKGVRGIISYQKETDEEIVQQFSVSPVMDTAYAVRALCLAGVEGGSETILSAVKWLMTKQATREGDWKHNNPDGEPGGWGFEFHNTWYPDLDCTSMVLNAITFLAEEDRKPFYPQIDKGLNWILSMQNWDGGFAVWDKNNWLFFRMLSVVVDVGDYSHVDITARVVNCMANLLKLPRYKDRGDLKRALRIAARFIWGRQEGFRCWYGRWGVNYTYATGQVLEAMGEKGVESSSLLARSAVNWLVKIQNPDGGWGESVESYEKSQFVPAPSTVMQTAAVLKGLMGIGASCNEVILRGIVRLLDTQRKEGHWEDRAFFAVNIPRVWYGRYDLLSTLYALIALCEYRDRFLQK